MLAVSRRGLSPGGVCVDIGANMGVYTLAAAQLVGSTGHVFAVEPDTMALRALQRNLAHHQVRHVTTLAIALADQTMEGTLYQDSPGSSINSLVPFQPRALRSDRPAASVQMWRLDDYAATHDLRVDRWQLIKIDVEEAELLVLRGMIETLGRAGYPRCFVKCVERPVSIGRLNRRSRLARSCSPRSATSHF